MSSTTEARPVATRNSDSYPQPVFKTTELSTEANANANANDLNAVSNTPYVSTPRGRSAWKEGTKDYHDALRALPEVRSIPWAPGKQLPPEKSINSTRGQTRGAFLLATRGRINDPPCTHCSTGLGRFLHCISLDDWFHGACATCQMGTRGNLCSMRADIEGSMTDTFIMHTSKEVDSRSPSTSAITNKRKRESLADNSHHEERLVSYSSPYAASRAPERPYPASQNFHAYQPPNGVAPYSYPPDDPNAPVNYIYKRPEFASGTTHVFNAHVPPQSSQSSYPIPLQNPQPTYPIQTQNLQPNHSKPPQVQAPPYNTPHVQSNDAIHVPSPSPSPSAQLLEAQMSSSREVPSATGNGLGRQEEPPVTIIDSYPRKKQKKILGIIGTLQSGIRNAQEQANNLQKQLDHLQVVLGIEDEDDDESSYP